MNDIDNAQEASVKRTESRKAAFTAAFLLIAVLLYLLAGLFFGFYIPCPFRTFTGLRCPGCGLSHAAVCLAHFDVRGAFRENALFIPVYAYLIYSFIKTFIPKKKDPHTGHDSGMWIDMIFLVIVIIWWIIRNVYGI